MLKRWHGRMGVVAALFVLTLGFTGLCLNHVSSWGFDSKALRSPALLGLYGMSQMGEVVSYPLGNGYISESEQQLFYGRDAIGSCDGALVGAVLVAAQVVLACERQLLLLTPTFELIEKIGPALGLPLAVERLGVSGEQLLIDTTAGYFFASLDTLSWTPTGPALSQVPVRWSTASPPPEALRQALAKVAGSDDITYERLLLDIHSGRILGEWGVYLVDVMALLFMLLAMSGLVIWLKGQHS